MSAVYNPIIVVVAYNRPHSLARLLSSLSLLTSTRQPKLLISIDNAGLESTAVKELADSFDWKWEKEVVLHEERKGLKEHIHWCAQKAIEHGSVIILEDDLVVSPNFYDQACTLLNAYGQEPSVAGVSLYTYNYNESTNLPWRHIKGNGDVHLMRQVSSWGQAWTAAQWKAFETWKSANEKEDLHPSIPNNIRQWPASSWKKHFIDYVVSEDLFIVYPNDSLTSNSGDAGTHFSKKYKLFRAPLNMGTDQLNCPPISDIDSRYDLSHELLAAVFKQKNPLLAEYDLEVDFYGTSQKGTLKKEYCLTTRSCSRSLLTWGIELEPLESNVLLNIQGEGISLAKSEDVQYLDADRLQRYAEVDKSPEWVHDALGKPLSTQLEKALSSVTKVAFINSALVALFRFFKRS